MILYLQDKQFLVAKNISNVLEANNGTIPEGFSVEWINIDKKNSHQLSCQQMI